MFYSSNGNFIIKKYIENFVLAGGYLLGKALFGGKDKPKSAVVNDDFKKMMKTHWIPQWNQMVKKQNDKELQNLHKKMCDTKDQFYESERNFIQMIEDLNTIPSLKTKAITQHKQAREKNVNFVTSTKLCEIASSEIERREAAKIVADSSVANPDGEADPISVAEATTNTAATMAAQLRAQEQELERMRRKAAADKAAADKAAADKAEQELARMRIQEIRDKTAAAKAAAAGLQINVLYIIAAVVIYLLINKS